MGVWPLHGETHLPTGSDPIPYDDASGFGNWQTPALTSTFSAHSTYPLVWRREPGKIIRLKGAIVVQVAILDNGLYPYLVTNDPNLPSTGLEFFPLSIQNNGTTVMNYASNIINAKVSSNEIWLDLTAQPNFGSISKDYIIWFSNLSYLEI